ncbi:MAG: helix-turn-helix domain-containing protein [Gemmiger formicilis]|uniref:helix-turn-helix domain-containing protein n=1 Tax=Gemmiger formicilis TaxID=745368 RepID=UPI003995F5BE
MRARGRDAGSAGSLGPPPGPGAGRPFWFERERLQAVLPERAGRGYLAYFRRRRLERAAELLRTTPQRVQDIAARVGYESQGRFAQAFYDQFRLTPLEYRRLSK